MWTFFVHFKKSTIITSVCCRTEENIAIATDIYAFDKLVDGLVLFISKFISNLELKVNPLVHVSNMQ